MYKKTHVFFHFSLKAKISFMKSKFLTKFFLRTQYPIPNIGNSGQGNNQQQFCEDKRSDCAENKMYCHGKNSEWMNINCQRTCRKCHARPQQQYVDCQWSEWQYGPCSRTCGNGERLISRTEVVKALNGGKPCFEDGTKTMQHIVRFVI